MCTMVYLASHRPLALIARDSDAPGFHTESLDSTELAPETREHLRSRFSKPIVYRLGSNQHCGCGFSYFEQFEGGYHDPEELAAAERSRESLVRYLEAALRDEDVLEVWISWAGDEGNETEDQHHVCPEEFRNPEIFASEKVLFSVRRSPF